MHLGSRSSSDTVLESEGKCHEQRNPSGRSEEVLNRTKGRMGILNGPLRSAQTIFQGFFARKTNTEQALYQPEKLIEEENPQALARVSRSQALARAASSIDTASAPIKHPRLPS